MGSSLAKMSKEFEYTTPDDVQPSPPEIRKLELDPRSPSLDIVRTPIEVLKTPTNTANDNFNITDDLTTNLIESEDFANLDPRSPTQEFQRTPIIINNTLNGKPLRNKLLERVKEPDVVITPARPKRIGEINKNIYNFPQSSLKGVSPRLLHSRPITVTIPENKRNSIVGLLETNIDFVETDLDAVIQSKVKKHEPSVDDENISSTDSGSTESFQQTLEYIIDDMGHGDNLSKKDISNQPEEESESEDNKNIPESDSEVIDSVNELNKKLSDLIYQDAQSKIPSKFNKVSTLHRPPLSDCNTNNQLKKAIPVLKVSDRPTKSISKIPISKERIGKSRVNMQCENTPPRMQTKRSQWGAEDSLII